MPVYPVDSFFNYDLDHMARMAQAFIDLLPENARRRETLARGDFVFRQQQPTRAIHAVESGRVRLFRHLPDGSAVTLHLARDGDTFAEAALFATHYHCDAQAETDTTLIRLDSEALRTLIRDDAELGIELSEVFAGQVRELRAMLTLRDIRSADERLLAWLRLKAVGERMEVVLDRPWTGISEELGLTREAVYRSLARLQKLGVIERYGKQDGESLDTIRLVRKKAALPPAE